MTRKRGTASGRRSSLRLPSPLASAAARWQRRRRASLPVVEANAHATSPPRLLRRRPSGRRRRRPRRHRRRRPGDHRGCRPETTAAPVETAPPPTLPENVTELDPEATSNINPQPRDSLQQGGTLRLAVGSLAENWNPAHPDGNEARLLRHARADELLPVADRRRGRRHAQPDYVLEFAVRGPLTLTYTLNPEAVWHSGNPITPPTSRRTGTRSTGLNPEFQVVSTEGYDLITSVEQGADEFEVIVTFCEPYPGLRGAVLADRAGGVGRRPRDVQHRMGRPDQQRLV